MRRILLFFGLLVCMPAMMAVGLGPGLFSDSGGGGGVLHPISGVDSQICIGENSAHAGGSETICTILDAAVDVTRDQTHYLNLYGLSGSRIIQTYVDDGASAGSHAQVREVVRLNASTAHTANTNNLHLLQASITLEIYNNDTAISGIAGGKVRVDAFTVRSILGASTANENCDWAFYKAESGLTNTMDATTKADGGGWEVCTGTISQGPDAGQASTGGIGDDDILAAGSFYHLPVDDCACASTDCRIVLTVVDPDPGVVDCNQVRDSQVSIFVSEVYP